MKKVGILITIAAAVFAAACGDKQPVATEQTRMQNTQANQGNQTGQNSQAGNDSQAFPRGERAPQETFTGTVYVQPLVPKNENNNFSVASVTFEPGARAFWHTHPAGQTILVTAGKGLYQEKGKAVRPLNKGDVVLCDPDIEHWHGASPDSSMTHVVITNYKGETQVNWLRPVTDAEYGIVSR